MYGCVLKAVRVVHSAEQAEFPVRSTGKRRKPTMQMAKFVARSLDPFSKQNLTA